MKKIYTKEVFVCTSFKEVVDAYNNGDYIYFKDEDYGAIHSIYVDDCEDNPPIESEDDAKNAIGIYDLDANFQESVDYYNATPNDFYVEQVVVKI